jgi:hypothetical protein
VLREGTKTTLGYTMRIPVVDSNHQPLMPTTPARARWTSEEDALILTEYGVTSLRELLRKLPGRTRHSIIHRRRILGVPGNAGASQAKYKHDVNFFSRKSLVACYFAGFIAADGCVFPPKKTVKIAVHSRDRNILEHFRDATQFTGVIRDHAGGNYKPDEIHSSISVHNAEKWIRDLETIFNIVQAKTKVLLPPSLNGDDAHAFIAGYLDGDGSIFQHQGRTVVSFRGTVCLLEWIKTFADKIQVSAWKPAQVQSHGSIAEYRIVGKRAETFLQKLSALDIPLLKRKWRDYV